MADARVFLVAWLKPKAGKEADLAELLRGMCAPSRAEAGCVFYNLFEAAGDGGPFHFIECWRDQPALDAHRGTPHYKAFREKVGDLLAEPPGVQLLRAVDAAF